ncbi:hypothetical protein N7478_000722 [Penicillium angulare]|uniref:uncharacterized protein n=1 Tax=Penicillium angulare TaxID=116970 RepID=UPI0025409B71|nr:uncharacterized protein N7478_000722 [Penicillium angulare]KAJ5291471.1 hypothetical protein N7478_000722 [Penicillium angulare]
MDHQNLHRDALRTITSLNTRAIRAERILSRYEEEFATLQASFNQAKVDIQETARVMELLYETNRVLRDVVTCLVKQRDVTPDSEILKCSDRLLNILAQQVRRDVPDTSTEACIKPRETGATVFKGRANRYEGSQFFGRF